MSHLSWTDGFKLPNEGDKPGIEMAASYLVDARPRPAGSWVEPGAGRELSATPPATLTHDDGCTVGEGSSRSRGLRFRLVVVARRRQALERRVVRVG